MLRSTTTRLVIGVAGYLAVLAVLRFKPWQQKAVWDKTGRPHLTVGFLPVT